MTVYSLVAKKLEDVPPASFGTGVTRFDESLRAVFDGLVSVTPARLPAFGPDDVVIADNHLSVLVPETTPCIVVHHGCAATHHERDPSWRGAHIDRMIADQGRMLRMKRRLFVAPSAWVRGEFARHYSLPGNYARVIVNRAALIDGPRPPMRDRLVVLGDWRDSNKGSAWVGELRRELREWDFRPLRCRTVAEREQAYRDADAYLCLSMSEGGSYAMCDAEAAGLPIVSTDVGNAREFGCALIEHGAPAQDVSQALRAAMAMQRPSYFDAYGFDDWAADWRNAVEDAQCA